MSPETGIHRAPVDRLASAVADPEPPVARSGNDTRAHGRYPARFRWLGYWFLAAAAVVVVTYQLVPAGLPKDLVYQVMGLAAAGAIVVGVRIHQPVDRLPWYLLAAGQLLWSVADAVGSWDSDVLGNDRFPSPADPIYLLGYPTIVVGLLLLVRGRRPRRDVAGFLDSAILTVALAILSWVLLAGPTIKNYQDSLAAAVVAVAYPLGDIVLAGLLIRLITTPGGRTRSFGLLVTGIGLLITVDTAASALSMLTVDSTLAINFLWLSSYAAFGAAALDPSMVSLSEPAASAEVRFSRARLTALTLAVLVAPATMAVQAAAGFQLDVWPVVIGSVVIFLLVVARMNLSIDQIQAANRRTEAAQAELARQAAHDPLTGLPNRGQGVRLIRNALSRAQRSGEVIGLLFVDLDGFKQVNDTLGHRAGDEVLRAAAERMQVGVRSGDTVARLGGDEFVVLLEPLDVDASAVDVANRLVSALSAPLILTSGREVTVGASIGVAISQDADTDPERLLHEADVAVYRAKAGGRGRTEVFDRALREELDRRGEVQAGVATALRSGELVVGYRPIVRLASREVVGFEAQVSWPRPGATELSRLDIVPAIERSELICDLDSWVLRQAVREAQTRVAAGCLGPDDRGGRDRSAPSSSADPVRCHRGPGRGGDRGEPAAADRAWGGSDRERPAPRSSQPAAPARRTDLCGRLRNRRRSDGPVVAAAGGQRPARSAVGGSGLAAFVDLAPTHRGDRPHVPMQRHRGGHRAPVPADRPGRHRLRVRSGQPVHVVQGFLAGAAAPPGSGSATASH